MAGTLNTPSVVEPIKALGFYSFVVTIPDDDVYMFTPKGSVGHIFLATDSSGGNGLFWYRGSLMNKYGGPLGTVNTTGTLTGTTGADGDTTLSASGNNLYIENRTGVSREYVITLICGNDAYE